MHVGAFLKFDLIDAQKHAKDKLNVGIRQPYIRVVGIQVDTDGPGRTAANNLMSPDEEEAMRTLASSPNIYDTISRSVAPSSPESTRA